MFKRVNVTHTYSSVVSERKWEQSVHLLPLEQDKEYRHTTHGEIDEDVDEEIWNFKQELTFKDMKSTRKKQSKVISDHIIILLVIEKSLSNSKYDCSSHIGLPSHAFHYYTTVEIDGNVNTPHSSPDTAVSMNLW